jgi:hypothetical protein
LVSERVVQQNRSDGVKYIMQNETTTVHVSPIRLWQALCGGVQLPQGQYQHVIHCVACEKLATQIGDALDDIEEALRRNHIGVPGGSQSTSRLN